MPFSAEEPRGLQVPHRIASQELRYVQYEEERFVNDIHPLCANRFRQVLCDTLSLSQLDPGAFLMEKGDKGNLFFVVDSGELEKIEDGKVI